MVNNKHFRFSRALIKRIMANNVTGSAAQMSYYLIMAFFPFVIFLISSFSYSNLFEYSLPDLIQRVMPEDTAFMLIKIIDELLSARSGSLASISMLTTIFFASKGVNAIIAGMNKSFQVTESRNILKKTFLSITFTILFVISINFLFIFIIMGRLITETLISFLGIVNFPNLLWVLLRFSITLSFIFLVISFIYVFFPNLQPRLRFKEVMAGSIFTTVFWIVGSFAFSYYVNNFSKYTLIYGSITGIIVFLLWLFISSIILLSGAEINALLKTIKNR